MLNRRFLLFLAVLLTFVTFQPVLSQTTSSKSFTFILKNSATTSAGVYNSNGTLIRTLWGNKNYSAGSHTEVWDGKDDRGAIATDSDCIVKVLSNNVQYKWEGVIGNTSDYLTGTGVLSGFERLRNMVIAGQNLYTSVGYQEANKPTIFRSSISSPNTFFPIALSQNNGSTTTFLTTDDDNVYVAQKDAFNPSLTFVWAFTTQGENEVYFRKGAQADQLNGRDYNSAISINKNASDITGLAVQKNGNYLFVARSSLNQIQVINKTTGDLIRNLNVTSPGDIKVDSDNGLYVVNNTANIINKYTINNNGTITPDVSFSGLVDPRAISVSPDDRTILVADGGKSCQIKAFNSSTGDPLWTYGQAGGYSTNATVANNKFFFSNVNGSNDAFIEFQPDGSFWIGEPENNRIQHFSASGTYIDRIMFLGQLYSQFVNSTDPTRVTARYLEFKIDYSKGLDNGKNRSWRLVKNWSYNIPSGYDDKFENLRCITTLSNGRTYALMMIINGNQNFPFEVIELDNNIRFTGIRVSNTTQLYADGSLRNMTPFVAGQQTVFKKQDLKGFDGNNNPIWSSPYIIATSPIATNQDPLFSGINHTTLTSGEITTSGKIITFEGGKTSSSAYGSSGYHLGAIDLGGNSWTWRTSKSTQPNYSGAMPTDGTFDIGNGVTYPGGSAKVLGNNIFWNYHGEFWKSSQTNIFNHFYENGLMVGQFGVLGPDVGINAAPMMAGNVFYPNIVKDPNDSDNAYLYHGDESHHGGIHRWKITGLNSIEEQVLDFDVTTVSDQTEGIDLMQGLSGQSVLLNGKFGWNRNPSTQDVLANKLLKFWSVSTGYKSNATSKSPDVFIEYNQGGPANYTVTRDLGANSNVASWKLWGDVNWNGSQENQSDKTGGSYIDVLDDAGKVIARIYRQIDFVPNGVIRYIYVNGQILAKDASKTLYNKTKVLQPIEISADNNGSITFKYADYPAVTTSIYDPAANWNTPKTLRFLFYSRAGALFQYYRTLDIMNMRFAISADGNTSIDPPAIMADDNTNTIAASHPLNTSEILVSENNGPFLPYTGEIQVGNVDRPAGYWKFKIKAAAGRNASGISLSPDFNYTNVIPDAPTVISDDTAKVVSATHPLGTSEILVSVNNGPYQQYVGPIDEGNVARPVGYYTFKIKATNGRNESPEAESDAFTFTPAAPTIIADDEANTIRASSPLGNSQILTSINGGPFLPGFGRIFVGDYTRPQGYYRFKISSASQRSESAIAYSPDFTTTPDMPDLIADDVNNTLTASHSLGTSEILVSTNNGPFQPYQPIDIGNIDRPSGYWKFKIKAANGRSESDVANSPAFNFTSTPDAPTVIADDVANTITASSPLGSWEILTSINGGPYLPGFAQIYVGNFSRPAGFYKYKIRSAQFRNESDVVYSPAFTANTSAGSRTFDPNATSLNSVFTDSSNTASIADTTIGIIKTSKAKTNVPVSIPELVQVGKVNIATGSNTDKILPEKAPKLTVFPNPVVGVNLTMNLLDFLEGKYTMRLIDINGSVIMNKEIVHTGNKSSHAINVKSNLPSGLYIIEVKGASGALTTRVIKN